jgi:hypothetical protein
MWSIPGRPIKFEHLKALQPLQVLYDFDGPRTFTFLDQENELYLAHWCDEESDRVRYIAVPFSEGLLTRLEHGQMSLREALDQPRVWVLEVDQEGQVQSGWRVNLSDLPEDVLPRPGTLLLPSLENEPLSG